MRSGGTNFRLENGLIIYYEFTTSNNIMILNIDTTEMSDKENIVIPEEHNGYKITEIYRVSDLNIKNIVLPNSIKRIDDYAFANSNIENIKMPNKLRYLGKDAFSNCRKLTSIEIPGSVNKIHKNAFAFCDKLTTVILNNGTKTLGNNAFYNCPNLYNVKIPNTLQTIKAGCFSHDKELYITNLKNVSMIESQAFAYCGNIKKIIMNQPMILQSRVFYLCKNLKEIDFNDTAKNIWPRAIESNPNLKFLYFKKDVEIFSRWMFDNMEGVTIKCEKGTKIEAQAKQFNVNVKYNKKNTLDDLINDFTKAGEISER